MTRKTITEFINEHRDKLTAIIRSIVPNLEIDDFEIEMWIINDEALYNWALNEGVTL